MGEERWKIKSKERESKQKEETKKRRPKRRDEEIRMKKFDTMSSDWKGGGRRQNGCSEG